MALYYLLLFATPFHEDPRLGMVLVSAGALIVTPVKIWGFLTVASAWLVPPSAGSAPRLRNSLPALFFPFAVVPATMTAFFGLPLPGPQLGQLISAVLLFGATRSLVRTEARMVKVTKVLVIAFTFGSLWVYKQYFIEHDHRPPGLEGDSNYEALVLLMALPPAFWMARLEKSRWWRRIGVICGALLAGAVVLTESRAGIIAGGAMGLLGTARARHKLVGVMLLAGAAALIFDFGPSGLMQRFEGIKFEGAVHSSNELSPRIHAELLKAGLRMMEAHPVFGVGLGQFKPVAPEYNPELLTLSNRSWIAHDTFVQIGAEEGIPALLLFLAMLGVALRNLRSAQRGYHGNLAALAVAMEISLIGIVLVALSISADFLAFCIVVVMSQNLREIVNARNIERLELEGAATRMPRTETRAA